VCVNACECVNVSVGVIVSLCECVVSGYVRCMACAAAAQQQWITFNDGNSSQ